jgi:hypothetical protein
VHPTFHQPVDDTAFSVLDLSDFSSDAFPQLLLHFKETKAAFGLRNFPPSREFISAEWCA